MEIRFKFWLEKNGEVLVSDGKAGILKSIDELGSIQKAAEKIGMSYRHAWGIIQKLDRRSGLRFVETQVGGKEGGSARLTPAGRDFLRKFASFRRGLDEYIEKKFEKAFGKRKR
ncbi:MAG TPA: LysR family transcriptional regulator [Thermodesulfobacteriota bacterium]|nr:LysR family transcriptional regulator [Thermodesulfobacteriota bacterium]